MNTETEKVIERPSIWLRGAYMLLFAFLHSVAKFLTFVVAILQFLAVLIYDSPNHRLLQFGQSLSTYNYQIFQFLTFNAEEHPFPLGEWPTGSPGE